MSIHIGILCCSIVTLPLEAKNYSPHPKKHWSTAVEKKHSRSNRKIIEIHLSHCWTNSIRRLLYKYILRLLCSINTITLRMSVKFSFLGAKFLMETHFCDIFSTTAQFVCSYHSSFFCFNVWRLLTKLPIWHGQKMKTMWRHRYLVNQVPLKLSVSFLVTMVEKKLYLAVLAFAKQW